MNVFQQHLSASFNVFHRNTHQSCLCLLGPARPYEFLVPVATPVFRRPGLGNVVPTSVARPGLPRPLALVRPSHARSLPQWLWDQRRNPSSRSPCRRNPRRHSPCRCNPNTARRGARSIPRSIGFLIAADATCGFFFRCCCELMYELAMDFHAWIFPQVQWICVWIYVWICDGFWMDFSVWVLWICNGFLMDFSACVLWICNGFLMDFSACVLPQFYWCLGPAKNPRRHCAKKSTKNPRLIHATSGGPKQKNPLKIHA